jgi:hypothetical protein
MPLDVRVAEPDEDTLIAWQSKITVLGRSKTSVG